MFWTLVATTKTPKQIPSRARWSKLILDMSIRIQKLLVYKQSCTEITENKSLLGVKQSGRFCSKSICCLWTLNYVQGLQLQCSSVLPLPAIALNVLCTLEILAGKNSKFYTVTLSRDCSHFTELHVNNSVWKMFFSSAQVLKVPYFDRHLSMSDLFKVSLSSN